MSLGAKRVIELEVSGGFHSSLMSDAVAPMNEKMSELEFAAPEIDFYSNNNGQKVNEPQQIKNMLVKQSNSPVRWIELIENMAKDFGEDIEFLEVGPGKVLQGLVKRINRKLKVKDVSTPDDAGKLIEV